MSSEQKLIDLPVLPVRSTVVFPYMIIPLAVGRPRSLAAIEAALSTEEKLLIVIAERHPVEGDPKPEDLYRVGTLVVIKKMQRMEGDQMQFAVQGLDRVEVIDFDYGPTYLRAKARILPEPVEDTPEVEALRRSINEMIGRGLSLLPGAPPELASLITGTDDPVKLAYLLGTLLNLDLEREQALLEANSREEILRLAHSYLAREIQVLEVRSRIAGEAQAEMSKAQRDYILRQQLKAIQKELGEQEPEQAEANLLRERLEKADLPDEVRKEAERELSRMERLPTAAPDYHVIRTYIELILDLPWRRGTQDILDLERARQVLDEDHYNLKEVKERILEHLAVIKLKPDAKSPILCFVGPPGVGKTSLGMSIARALGRKFERMSLGGVRDEAELRGHRRTYIGALPGRIIQALRRAEVNNPVLMLDEVDKLGADFRGDPASALLEILDPEQNHTFRDHYLDLPFDLSRIFFICTANSLAPIPAPLRDRMEIIYLSGYSEEEKLQISKHYLIPRQIERNGLKPDQLTITEDALRGVLLNYTRESGVRQLERTIGRLARKVALRVARGEIERAVIRGEDLEEYLGPGRFFPETARQQLPPGVATGLAWTEMGGEVLFVEATLLPGGKGLTLTGQLGDVMQESARAAQSYLWAHAKEFDIDRELFEKAGVHLHVPSGAIPKDGPSAGVTMTAALASMYTGKPTRSDTAMTGEITLSGLVLPVGGIKEKVLAARRAGIRRVILPERNRSDLKELPDEVRADLEFIFIKEISEALHEALVETAVAV